MRQRHHSAEQLKGADRFGARTVLGWLMVIGGVVPFLVLWLMIRDSSTWLPGVDRRIAAELNEAVHGFPLVVSTLQVVTELAGTSTAVLIFTLTTAFLAIQQRWRLTIFTVTAGVGLALLIPASKALIGRARPIVEVPVAETPMNDSFPSGHSMTAVVLWGALTLVALPAVGRTGRRWLVAIAVLLIAVIGFTRMALGVHFLSDVVAGWALGGAWLAAMVIAFRTWPSAPRQERPLDPLEQAPAEVVRVNPPERVARNVGSRAFGMLGAAAFAIAAFLSGLGLLVTGVWQDTWLGRWDRNVVAYMVEARTETLTNVADLVSSLSGTTTVVALALAASVLALAVTRSWRPMLFVAFAQVGEVILYLVVREVVDRNRPQVSDLTTGLPSAASWPSGHAAAAVVLYGGVAAILVRYSTSLLRWVAVVIAVLVPLAVSVSRVYDAAHYPTDVVAGLVLGAAWLLACIHSLLPPRQRAVEQPDRAISVGSGAGDSQG